MASIVITLAPLFLFLSCIFASPERCPAINDLFSTDPKTRCSHPDISILRKCLTEATEYKDTHSRCVHDTYWIYNTKHGVFDAETIVDLCPKFTSVLNRMGNPFTYGQGTSISLQHGSKDCTYEEVLAVATKLVNTTDRAVSSPEDSPRKLCSLKIQLRIQLTLFLARSSR